MGTTRALKIMCMHTRKGEREIKPLMPILVGGCYEKRAKRDAAKNAQTREKMYEDELEVIAAKQQLVSYHCCIRKKGERTTHEREMERESERERFNTPAMPPIVVEVVARPQPTSQAGPCTAAY